MCMHSIVCMNSAAHIDVFAHDDITWIEDKLDWSKVIAVCPHCHGDMVEDGDTLTCLDHDHMCGLKLHWDDDAEVWRKSSADPTPALEEAA